MVFALSLMIFFTLFGCSNNQHSSSTKAKNDPTTNNQKNKTSNQLFNSSVYLKKIDTNYATPNSSDTPVGIILKSIKWTYSNGKIGVPNENNIMWKQSFGNVYIITLKVPKLAGVYNFIIFQKGKDRWHFKGVMTQSPERQNINNQGIQLPMKSFTQGELNLDKRHSVWSFTDSHQALLIGKYPTQPIDSKNFKTIKLQNGKTKGWVINNQNKTFLFYYDKNQLVWLVGNFTPSKIEALASSLPSTTDSNFPFKK